MSTNNAWKVKTKKSRKKIVARNNNRRQNKNSREEAKFIREYDELLPGSPRKKAPYNEPKTIGEYAPHLQGPSQNRFGGHQTQQICGLKGNTYGAAGPCRTLTAEEQAKVEADLRGQGDSSSRKTDDPKIEYQSAWHCTMPRSHSGQIRPPRCGKLAAR